MQETYQIRMAKAPKEDIDEVSNFLQELEEKTDNYSVTDEELGEWVNQNFHRIYGKYERILTGFSVLSDNVCDPTLDYLDYTPEIKREKLQLQFMKEFILHRLGMNDADVSKEFESWLKDNSYSSTTVHCPANTRLTACSFS